ncbi:MAG: threonine ammonia-lyase [Minwuia sp.]|uniref:threonine ammonia-lyase n=1 Tax=Minwuia sp. TaxID=2493630 RepID=UPI003A8C3EB4
MDSIGFEDIRQARARIAGAVRRTPLMRAAPIAGGGPDCDLYLKLENLQLAGSFKSRGAANTALSLGRAALEKGLITASGGNHGLGVAAAAQAAGVPAVIHLSTNATPDKVARLEGFGAEVVVEGAVWDDANALALARAETDGSTYVHPFANPMVIAGQGTVALEVLEDLPDAATVVIAIGGGGLISGMSVALKQLRPDIRIVGVEAEGAPTLKRSVEAGELVTLETITSSVATLSPRRSSEINLDIVRRLVDEIVLVSDAEMAAAARWMWSHFGIAAELAGAAGMAAVQQTRFAFRPDEKVVVLVCGAGTAAFS